MKTLKNGTYKKANSINLKPSVNRT